MRDVETYRGFRIVETDWTTTVLVPREDGPGTVESIESVYIIRDLKERFSHPYLTSVADCREYIDFELAGRELDRVEDGEEDPGIRW